MESCKHRRTVFRSMAVLGFTAVLLAQPVAPASAAAPAVRACNLPYPPGEHTLTLQSGGLDRAAIVYVPSGYDGRHRLPLVLTLHGSQSDAAEQLERSELASAAEQHTFIVAAPQGYLPAPPGYRWNVPGVTLPPGEPPDDERFLSDLIDYLQASLCLDAKRVYGTGYSGGGRMISQFACDYADRLAAIAPVAGLRAGFPVSGPSGPAPDPATCTPERPVPVVTFAGTAIRSIPTWVAARPIGSTECQRRWPGGPRSTAAGTARAPRR
jgi:polyhydroxybutyrate depolymerase